MARFQERDGEHKQGGGAEERWMITMVAFPGSNIFFRIWLKIFWPDLSGELARAEPIVALAYARFRAERERVFGAETTETLQYYDDIMRAPHVAGVSDGSISREHMEIYDDLYRRYVFSSKPEFALFGWWPLYIAPLSIPRVDRDSLRALGNEELSLARDREDRVRGRLAERAARKFRRMVRDDEDHSPQSVMRREAGQRWAAESCASDPEMIRAALRMVYPELPLTLVADPPHEG